MNTDELFVFLASVEMDLQNMKIKKIVKNGLTLHLLVTRTNVLSQYLTVKRKS